MKKTLLLFSLFASSLFAANEVNDGLNRPIEHWSYTNATARTGAVGLFSQDISKLAYQQDTGVYWRLTGTGPVWQAVPPDVAAVSNNFADSIVGGILHLSRPQISNLSDAGQLATWAGVTPGTGVTTWITTPSSANLLAAMATETGTGVLVFGTSPTVTTPNIVGTSTNDNATAGSVGEIKESVILAASAVSLTSGISSNITSISLTAGDWDVFGYIGFVATSTTSITQVVGGASNVSANFGTNYFSNFFAAFVPGTTNDAERNAIPTTRFSLSSTTTVFLVATAAFTVSTLKAHGRITARRMR